MLIWFCFVTAVPILVKCFIFLLKYDKFNFKKRIIKMINDLEKKVKEDFKNYLLRNYSLAIPDDWLTQCIQFIVETFPVYLL